MAIFRSCILCQFEICSAVIQERALCFMYGEYDTTCHDLLHKAKLPTLELGRE